MSDGTLIEWTDASWPVVAGCDKVSRGCKNCWAIKDSWRLAHNPAVADVYAGTVQKVGSQLGWTGLVRELPERLGWPVHWKKPRRIFVCSQSDLFHEKVSDAFIDQVFAVMAMCPRHTFQLLTKRPERLVRYLEGKDRGRAIGGALYTLVSTYPDLKKAAYDSRDVFRALPGAETRLPLHNVHLGFSAEDQGTFDDRWEHMKGVAYSGWLVWLSAEPLLGPIDLSKALVCVSHQKYAKRMLLRWVVSGGESGAGADPSHPDWFRQHRDQCAAAGVPWLFKQWGAWAPVVYDPSTAKREDRLAGDYTNAVSMRRLGKKLAGRLLDSRTHDGFPG